MPQVLVINPNTSETVTQALLHHLGAGLPRSVALQGVTAGFGAAYIADERSYCIAGHAVLDAWEQAQKMVLPPDCDAVLVGCFGDPGLEALRESCSVPVLGLAEAAMRTMAFHGRRSVAMVTGGTAWKPMLERWCRTHGYDSATAAVRVDHVAALAASGGDMMRDPGHAAQALADASLACLRSGTADSVLIGGAGLAGMGARVRALTGAPVWDCVEATQWWLACMLPVAAFAMPAAPDGRWPVHTPLPAAPACAPLPASSSGWWEGPHAPHPLPDH